jgi:hypothetical protein
MAKKRMSSRNVVESVDPMSAFVDMSEEPVEVEEAEAPKDETPVEESLVDMSASEAKDKGSAKAEEVPVKVAEETSFVPAFVSQEAKDKKSDVLDMCAALSIFPEKEELDMLAELDALPELGVFLKKTPSIEAPPPQETKKVDVLDMLHDTTMTPKTSILEKNALPLKLQNEPAEKPVAPKEAPNVGTLYDLLEVARQHANGYQRTWDDSIRAYARHMGFPAMASLENCKSFLMKWGAKIKD